MIKPYHTIKGPLFYFLQMFPNLCVQIYSLGLGVRFRAVVLKLWYAKTFKVVREEAYFLSFFTKNILTGVVFTCRVLLINSWIFVLPTSLTVF